MNRTMKYGLMAAVLFGGAALISAPASANSVHDEGYFGGGYTSIGPGPFYQRRGAGRSWLRVSAKCLKSWCRRVGLNY